MSKFVKSLMGETLLLVAIDVFNCPFHMTNNN
jgi:hypothetical protein